MSWSVVGGSYKWSNDEYLYDLGRHRFNQRRGRGGGATYGADIPLARGLQVIKEWSFVAGRVPRRLAAVAVGDHPDLVVALADTDTAVLCFKGDPPEAVNLGPTTSESGSLWSLLLPTWLGKLGIGDHPGEAFMIPGDQLDEDITIVPSLVRLGTDHYSVRYDPQLEIITSWEAFIDGQVSDRQFLSPLHASARA
ncbi:MAG: hypothetical protein WBZ07_03940 [Candidatus Dormiibacterota bacterium]